MHWTTYSINNNLTYKFNPYDPTDAKRDWDSDGLSNLEEFRKDKNPFRSDNYPDERPESNKNVTADDIYNKNYIYFAILGFIIVILLISLAIVVGKDKKKEEK